MNEGSELALRVEVSAEKPSRKLRKRVVKHLAEGALVALPTETVYGIAARADHPEAIAALRRLKGAKNERAFSWHVARRDVIDRFDDLQPLARRLAERYWPGPLTLVLRGVPEGLEGLGNTGWVGVRLPAHRTTVALISALDFPICLTSANLSGEEPCTDGIAVEERFGSELALIVDSGPCRLGESSGVLRLGQGHFDLLREGLLPIEDLRRTAGLRLGFCCTGNTCRSPMAEGLALGLLADRLGVAEGDSRERIAAFGFELTSFGTCATRGAPVSGHTLEILARKGIDLSNHLSTPATAELTAELDHVFCLTHAHLEALRRMLPPGQDGMLSLLDPAGGDIEDPIGGSFAVYERCGKEIAEALETRAADWA
ncbi:MAG: threonylcarbamoyl-AMP synthase [Planctomycetes bacterium]|nr:threonylcarbamoyl-AMP synthase [Planctomycetota bacterium]